MRNFASKHESMDKLIGRDKEHAELLLNFFIACLLTFANFLIGRIVVWETFTIFAA